MASTLLDILRPSVVTKIVSRIRVPGNVLSRFFGVEIGGNNVEQIRGRTYTYDLFDYVRTVANGRLTTAPAGTVAPNPVGNVSVTLMRSAEKLALDYNRIMALRELGKHAGSIDPQGRTYVERQAKELHRRQSNLREFTVGSLFRGGIYYWVQNGDDLIPTYDQSSSLFGVDLKIPATHKLIGGSFAAGLTMDTGGNLITASWATASTDIPLMISNISAAFQRQVGEPLAHIWCGSKVWNYVINNDKVRAVAGTASTPFAEYQMTSDVSEDGTRTGLQSAVLKAFPWIQWHIYDGGLSIAPSSSPTVPVFTKLIPDDYALFTIEKGDWLRGIEGSEMVKVNDLAPAQEQIGFFAWIMEKADPARFEMHTVQNFGLELNVPKAVAIARVA